MTLDEAIADVDATVAHWRGIGVSPAMAWLAMTGKQTSINSWKLPKALMIRLAIRRTPMRLAPVARFVDCPRAIRDHGSPRISWAA